MFRSAIIKMTLWYVAIAMFFSLIFSVFLYHFATVELREGLNDQYTEIKAAAPNTKINNLINQEFNDRAGQLYMQLLYFNVFVFVIATSGSFLLARRTLKPIEESHQSQTRFTALASHELRTPLAAIRADTESVLMLNNASNSLLTKTLKENLKDIERIETLANHLLEAAKYHSTTNNPTRFELRKPIEEAIVQAKRTKEGKKLNFETNLVAVKILGDLPAIELVASTLIDNAVKYSRPADLIKIEILANDKYALLKVHDNGIGISDEDQLHILEPFYRSAETKTYNPKGHGLGLFLAKGVIDAHKGKIEIVSKEGAGTTVIVTLPLA